MVESFIRTRPRRTVRVRYQNKDSDTDEYKASAASASRPSRAVRHVQTYRESSDENSSESSVNETGLDPHVTASVSRPWNAAMALQPIPKRKPEPSRKRKVSPGAKMRVSTSLGGGKRRETRAVHETTFSQATANVLPTGTATHTPPWQTLPYQILLSIFQYSAYPLYGLQSRPNASINWLCATGALCRTFHDACTGALLYSPPLIPLERATALIGLFQQERDRPNSVTTAYRARVRYLDVEVKQVLLKRGGIVLHDLVSLTPQLQGIRLYSNYDDMTTTLWARPEARKIRWAYPTGLMKRLEFDDITLKSFEWNGRFPGTAVVLKEVMAAHSRPPFRQLHELTFINITLPDKADQVDCTNSYKFLRGGLKDLSELRSLSFRNCGMIDKYTTPILPHGLIHLELTNCLYLTSSLVGAYLDSAGAKLQSLRLNNNQSMSLGFMAKLKSSCPKLQQLELHMVYIDPSSWRDRDPLFDELLPNGPPTWPSSLVSVSIENMRQLTEGNAEKFFTSLVDVAADLKYLKTLKLKVILKDASWRERARLRQKWMPVIENHFLNTANSPVDDIKPSTGVGSALQRQSLRLAGIVVQKVIGSDDNYESDGPPTQPVRRSCDVVDLVISDQRPAETQFHENDFLDSEPDDDEEYRDSS